MSILTKSGKIVDKLIRSRRGYIYIEREKRRNWIGNSGRRGIDISRILARESQLRGRGPRKDRMRTPPPAPLLLKGRMKLNMRRHAVSATFSMFAQWTSNSRGARKSGNRKIGFRPDERRENQNPQCNPSIHGAISPFFFSRARERSHIRQLSPISTLLYLSNSICHDTVECTLHEKKIF